MSRGRRRPFAGEPLELEAAPLSARAFAPFGEVIEAGADGYPINDGAALRRDLRSPPDVAAEGGTLRLGVVRTRARSLPLLVRLLERHPLGSQAFVPMTARSFLVVVAAGGDPPRGADLSAFVAGPGQGVSYRRGVWHHPLTALGGVGPGGAADFLVLDRAGPGENLEELELERVVLVRAPSG
ncbi:MAG TPA: ureidoglycolate lyase [Thermoanaerobaculia bacterium]|nr:ureidoglycolate lyase [Thermoanaerobaculia bacterium]